MRTVTSTTLKPGIPALLLLSALTSVSAQTLSAPNPLSIVSPALDSVQHGRDVIVEVRATEPIHSLQLSSTTTRGLVDVTRRLHEISSGRWQAELRFENELALGVNTLSVIAERVNGTKAHARTRFNFAQPQDGLLNVADFSPGPMRSPVQVTVHLAPGAKLRTILNGANVPNSFKSQGNGQWQASLGADDGLQFGHNELEVLALNATGTAYESARRSFFIDRDAPLVGAGPDIVGHVGTPIPLDGSATQASGKPSGLSFQWRLVSRPAGTAAGLLGNTNVKPGFIPDVPGRYRFELSASEPGKPTTIDSVEASVQPDVAPLGMPVETIVSTSNPGVQVGPNFYPLGVGNWAQLVVLDRNTLALRNNNVYPPASSSITQIAADISNLDQSSLVILSGSGGSTVFSDQTFQQFDQFLQVLYAKLGYAQKFESPGLWPYTMAGQFSLIGIPGAPAGSAYQFFGLQRATAAPTGDMKGFLQLDSAGNFAFVWPPEYIPFDTVAPGSDLKNQNVISIGGETQQIQTGGDRGFSVFWFDADTLNFRSAQFYSDCGSDGVNRQNCGLLFLPTDLANIQNDWKPALVIVVTSNKPMAGNLGFDQSLGWTESATAIAPFGANQQVFLGLDGSGDYSFLGLTGLGNLGPNQGVELSQVLTHTYPRITGLLTRNRQGLYEGRLNGPPDPVTGLSLYQNGLQQILAEPPQNFPAFASTAQAAAEKYIAQGLNLCLSTNPCTLDPSFGIRLNYWNNDSIDWANESGALLNLSPCSDPLCSPAFITAKDQLLTEFGYVDQVRKYFTGGGAADLDGVLNQAFTDGSYGFTAITQDILKLYNPPPSGTQSTDPMEILNASLSIASGLTGPIPEVGSGISGTLAVVQGTQEIISAVTANSSGVSPFDPSVLQQNIFTLGTNLEDAFDSGTTSLTRVADLLVSDWGRLQAADQRILSPGSNGGWGLDLASQTALNKQLRNGIAAYVWKTLLPVALQLALCPETPVSDSFCQIFGLLPSNPAERFPLLYASDNYVTQLTAFLLKNTGNGFIYPDTNTLQSLFGTGGNNIGLQPAYFLQPAQLDVNGNRITPGFTCNPFSFLFPTCQ